jgi:aminoglycoside 6'-N-acetyltransferase I
MSVRELNSADHPEWFRMRRALWPDCSDDRHELEMYSSKLESLGGTTLVYDRGNGGLGGFIEISVRAGVDGTHSTRVPYVEGWYVDTDLRRQGIGRRLIEAAEAWATKQGFNELASDAELHNEDSITAHKALGFQETFRVVQFLKWIPGRTD